MTRLCVPKSKVEGTRLVGSVLAVILIISLM